MQATYPNRIHLKVLGTHEKFLVCDNSWALITSHNFLTSGASQRAREVGLSTDDKNIIASLINRF
jgi:phosphatidylserine/phosphatidylglycerophosphate/cardiolipin synthase-like enzyme